MKKVILTFFILIGFNSCSLNDDTSNEVCGNYVIVPFSGFPLACNYTVKEQPTNPKAIIVTSQEKLEAYYTKQTTSCSTADNLTIDFTKNYLIGLFAGIKSSSGYEIKMTSVVENNCQIFINYYEKEPAIGETVSQTPSYPSDFILIPKTSKPILFNKTIENSDSVIIGSFNTTCTTVDCQNFYQLNDYNLLHFLNVGIANYEFAQYKYDAIIKRGEYSLFLKAIPNEILNLKGVTKTYGTPNSANQGGVYLEIRQAGKITKVYIDNTDTSDQSAEIKAFKKIIQDKIVSLK